MLEEIGGLLGWITGILYGLTILNYILKFVNKKFSNEINKNKDIKKYYTLIAKYIIKYHKVFGFSTIIGIVTHFIIQFSNLGISISGVVAAIIMIIQVISGMFIKKREKGAIFKVHRLIALFLMLAIGIHILLG